jgi:prophage regulatory protein
VSAKNEVNGYRSRAPISDGHKANRPATAVDPGVLRVERLRSVPLKFLRFHAVRDRTGLSRSTIWRLERRGEFPKHRRISTNAVGWLEQEINDWMLAKTGAD